MFRLRITSLTVLVMTFFCSVSTYAEIKFESGYHRVLLLEVYSSQGCSSCPPAERWVNQWKTHPAVFDKLIPAVFHVDYWDYLGWKDPFANAAFSERQSNFKQQGLSNAVYTPGFILDGQEWRGWFAGKSPKLAQYKTGNLVLTLANQHIKVNYSKASPADQLNLAILGFGIRTFVPRGENRRKTLEQEFVVLHHKVIDKRGDGWSTSLEKPSQSAQEYALIAWVNEKKDLRPKQAVGGFIPAQSFHF